MPAAFVRRPTSSSSAPRRDARTLATAALVAALGIASYPAWHRLVAGDAFERLTGMRLDAELRLDVRLVPAVPAASRAMPARSLRLGANP